MGLQGYALNVEAVWLIALGALVWIAISATSQSGKRQRKLAGQDSWSASSRRVNNSATSSNGIGYQKIQSQPNSGTAKSNKEFVPTDKCNRCGGYWVKKINSETGGKFFSCANYPKCKNTRGKQIADLRCTNGHARTAENTTYNAAGQRRCMDCFPELRKRHRTSTWEEVVNAQSPTWLANRRWLGKDTKGQYCENGHPRYLSNSPNDPNGHWTCVKCANTPSETTSPQEDLAKIRDAIAAITSRRSEETCRNGHKRTLENTYYRPNGDRECRICRKLAR